MQCCVQDAGRDAFPNMELLAGSQSTLLQVRENIALKGEHAEKRVTENKDEPAENTKFFSVYTVRHENKKIVNTFYRQAVPLKFK